MNREIAKTGARLGLVLVEVVGTWYAVVGTWYAVYAPHPNPTPNTKSLATLTKLHACQPYLAYMCVWKYVPPPKP